MSNPDFMSFTGEFICKTCKATSKSARFWYASAEVSWICSEKHISKVGLKPAKKKKKDFSNE